MTARLVFAAALLLAGACRSDRKEPEPATLGPLHFSVPSGWQRRDLSDVHTRHIEWTPPNNAVVKESIVVILTSPRAAHVKAGHDHVRDLLARSWRALPESSFGAAAQYRTRHGLAATRIEGTFVPPGTSERYHRVHAVLATDKLTSFVHVLYTAKIADREALDLVIGSLSIGG